MVYEGPVPTEFPAHIEFTVSEGHNCDHLKGTASADFDGLDMSNSIADDVISIDAIDIVDEALTIHYTVWGYDQNSDPPKFKANTCFAVGVNGFADGLSLHTSCSQPIELNVPFEGEAGGSFTILDGDGDCIPGDEPGEVDCPFENKLYWIAGDFRIPCSSPGNVTLNIYDANHFDDPKGTATGYFDGTGLTGITNDAVAQLWEASLDGNDLVVGFEAFGFDNDPPRFKAKTSFELVVEGCGTFRLEEYHTSCSQPIVVDVPQTVSPSGDLTFSNFCGCEENTVSTDLIHWGELKSHFR